MENEISLKWNGDMSFDADISGHNVTIDAKAEVGGHEKGPTPKKLMLVSLAGCSGMDVASLIKKMRIEVDSLQINVKANLTEEHPKFYDKVHVTYLVKGDNVDKAKFQKAVDLSQERYCGVSEMFRQFSELTYDIIYLF